MKIIKINQKQNVIILNRDLLRIILHQEKYFIQKLNSIKTIKEITSNYHSIFIKPTSSIHIFNILKKIIKVIQNNKVNNEI